MDMGVHPSGMRQTPLLEIAVNLLIAAEPVIFASLTQRQEPERFFNRRQIGIRSRRKTPACTMPQVETALWRSKPCCKSSCIRVLPYQSCYLC
ncbi:MAG: hypothetical protein JXB18_04835 [Sedimentisphaerales bacterium]|nr:hypothetical protein [Sedimentisphaerales bacterium]